MIALVDYGAGNLRSVEKALQAVGAEVVLTSEPDELQLAEKIVLPGVGAFAEGMAGLRSRGLDERIQAAAAQGKPLLGICLGMQLLFDESEEMGQHAGLGILPGRVRGFALPGLKSPQTGWNSLLPNHETPLLAGLEPGAYAYFNHSYYCEPVRDDDRLALTEYGLVYTSVVGRGRVYGVQFHPEKSQQVGLQILRNFVELG